MSNYFKDTFHPPQPDVIEVFGMGTEIMDKLAKLEALRHQDRELHIENGEPVGEENIWPSAGIESALNNIRTGNVGEYLRSRDPHLLKKICDCAYLVQRMLMLLQNNLIFSRVEENLNLPSSMAHFRYTLQEVAQSLLRDGRWVKPVITDKKNIKKLIAEQIPDAVNSDLGILETSHLSNTQWQQLADEGLVTFQELGDSFERLLDTLDKSADETLRNINEFLSLE